MDGFIPHVSIQQISSLHLVRLRLRHPLIQPCTSIGSWSGLRFSLKHILTCAEDPCDIHLSSAKAFLKLGDAGWFKHKHGNKVASHSQSAPRVPPLPLHLLPDKYPAPPKTLWSKFCGAVKSTIGKRVTLTESGFSIKVNLRMQGMCFFLRPCTDFVWNAPTPSASPAVATTRCLMKTAQIFTDLDWTYLQMPHPRYRTGWR